MDCISLSTRRERCGDGIDSSGLAVSVDALEGQFALTLAQARSPRAPRGRKWDKAEAQRLVLKLYLEQIDILERQMADLDKSLASSRPA
jgi:hypothetical protein